MKKLYLLVFLPALFVSMNSVSQVSALVLLENPSAMSNGNLGNQGNWIPNGPGTDVQVNDLAPLSYPAFPQGNKYFEMGKLLNNGTYNGKDPYKHFMNGIQVGANPNIFSSTIFYLAFLVKANQPRANGINVDWLLSFRTNDGKTLGHFYVKQSSGNTNKVNFGINTNPDTDSTQTRWTQSEYSLNTTYLIVLRYDLVRFSNNDRMFLWVNPSMNSEPSILAADAFQLFGQENYSTGSTIKSFQLNQGDYCPDVQFDAFKTAYAANGPNTFYNSDAAWNALSSGGGTLPVKFISFEVARKNKDILVEWSTAEEINNSHFEVQKSENGSTWNTIAQLNGAGNANSIKNYAYVDRNAIANLLYYRVRQVDLDGTFTYTPVRMVKNDNNQLDIKINSTSGNVVNIHFSKPVAGRVKIKLISLSGQVVDDQEANNPVGQIQLNTAGKAKGIYVVSIQDEQNLYMTRKIIL